MDYGKLGLKAGLEIHQQVDSKAKLFCKCPPMVRDDQPDVLIERRLRASAGESGSVDVAAAYEQQRDKKFIYQAYNDTVCAVELDEEPISDLNAEALYTGLQVAALFKAKPVDKVMVMRKTVVDGSNTSGFQRTALVARNGIIDLLSGKVGISSICVEEESAKVVKREPDKDVYNLSRLGIPLIEIATEPDISSPEQLRDVAEYIGMVLRSTRNVKRGLGTIRQDVNVSIREGDRVEIKGAQDLRMLVKLTENEAMRQQKLLEISNELKKRKAAVGTVADVTSLLGKSGSKLVQGTMKSNGKILAVKLKGFKGLVGREIQPERRLGTELSDYAKSFGKVTGIIHSDELPKYGIAEEETSKIAKKLGCGSEDAFAFVAAEETKANIAMEAVIARAKQTLVGIPREVRKANSDGTTTFLRPMPGSARMYPETDSRSVKPADKIELPQLLTDAASNIEKRGLSKNLAHEILKNGVEDFFELMVEENPRLNASYIAEVLVSYAKEMDARKLDHSKISDMHLKAAFKAVNNESLAKESVMDALADAAAGQNFDLDRYKTMNDAELEKELKKIIAENKGLPPNALIGKAMGKLRGKAAGKKVVEMLNMLLK